MTERPFRVELAPAAERQLRKLPPGAAAQLRDPMLMLGVDPRPTGATKLAGTEFWRIRVGDLRVIYTIDETTRSVVILKVARRSESTYRQR